MDIYKSLDYALITGATSGFGFEFAKLFAAQGYSLILISRDEERLQEISLQLRSAYNVTVKPIAKDLFNPNAPEEIYNEVTDLDLRVEFLINNAGQGEWGNFVETNLKRNLDIIQLNVISLVSLTKYFLTDMVARRSGRILQVGSEAGKTPMPLLSVYAATKAFVVSFSEALSNELKDTNVTVTLLLPGASDTDFFHKANADHTVTYREEKLASAEEVAKDGFEALMKGENSVISGTQTKIHVLKAKLMPDETNAESSRKSMEPSTKRPSQGRSESDHEASHSSREKINKLTGKLNGDYPPVEKKPISIISK
ncbi:MAG: oxidoreductase [Marivirga sp.]|nr:oxidoreductase [Marivirga sp.]